MVRPAVWVNQARHGGLHDRERRAAMARAHLSAVRGHARDTLAYHQSRTAERQQNLRAGSSRREAEVLAPGTRGIVGAATEQEAAKGDAGVTPSAFHCRAGRATASPRLLPRPIMLRRLAVCIAFLAATPAAPNRPSTRPTRGDPRADTTIRLEVSTELVDYCRPRARCPARSRPGVRPGRGAADHVADINATSGSWPRPPRARALLARTATRPRDAPARDRRRETIGRLDEYRDMLARLATARPVGGGPRLLREAKPIYCSPARSTPRRRGAGDAHGAGVPLCGRVAVHPGHPQGTSR